MSIRKTAPLTVVRLAFALVFMSSLFGFSTAGTVFASTSVIVPTHDTPETVLVTDKELTTGVYQSEPVIHYVDDTAIGANDGSSWDNAYTDLQSALASVASGEEIWVAAGTYKPTSGSDRSISFVLQDGAAILGGFAGNETLRTQRNYETNITTLSGDIGVVDDSSDNSYHVVVGTATSNSAVLDGFKIMAGNADGTDTNANGGGIYNDIGSPSLRNVIVTENSASMLGGGMFNGGEFLGPNGSSPILENVAFTENSATEGAGMLNEEYTNIVLTNVTFKNNTATRASGGMENRAQSNVMLTDVNFENNSGGMVGGGGMGNFLNDARLTNVTFSGNSATLYGGGVFNSGGTQTFTNVTFSGNSADYGGGIWNHESNITLTHVTLSSNSASVFGGGIYSESNSNTIVRNTILWGNTAPTGAQIHNDTSTSTISDSVVQGGFGGTNIITTDPLLGPLQDNGGFTQTMAPGAGSPAIDSADVANCPATDQRGITRPKGNGCDMGAVEAFPVSAAKPGTPVLLFPATGALVSSLQPAFDWKNSVPAAYDYQLQISGNVNFSILAVNKTGISTSGFTLDTNLIPGKRYYWRVRGLNVSGAASAWSTVWNFKTPLSRPELVSPLNDSSLLTDRPLFEWDAVDGATGYNIQASISDKFDTLLINATTANSESITLKDLPQNKALHWRVRAKTSAVNGPWSDKWSFTSGNPPSVPVLVSPIGNVLVRDFTPRFDWKNSILPMPVDSTTFKHYQIQVDDDQDFSSPEIDETTADGEISNSEFTPVDDLTPNTPYFWRARALNTFNAEQHSSGWSAVGTFRAVLPPPVLTSPVNLESVLTRKPTLEWQSVSGAGSYTIQISRYENLSSLIVNAKVNAPTYTPVNNLPNCARLYWRARANGQNGPGNWSEKRSFFVNSQACAYSHLYRVMDTNKTGNARRLLESYHGTRDGDIAWVYDNALAMIAFMSRGGTEDWSRAKVLANTFIYLQNNDPAHDGRLRDAYYASTLARATDQSATGNMAWVTLALLRYYESKGGTEYLNGAQDIGQWIYDHTYDTRGVDGYTGGYAANATRFMWKGTEHNIDVYVVFMKLYEATGDIQWRTRALVAKGFVSSMWNDVTNPGFFWTGTLEDGITTNTSPIPQDVQSWGLLALGEAAAFGEGLDWVEANLSAASCAGCSTCAGFRFSDAGSGCWWEGAAHMTLALQSADNADDAAFYLAQLRKVQTSIKNNNGRGIVAACPGGAVTGYDWTAPNALHVGATSWFIFAERGYNPLWGIGTDAPIPYEGEY